MPKPIRYHVYALIDPRTSEIRYVGKCKGPATYRLRTHIWEAKNGTRQNHRLSWLRSLLTVGMEPQVAILDSFDSSAAAIVAECCWIGRCRRAGFPLVNGTMGGEGMPNPSPETRAKLRARKIGPKSEEARRAASERMRQRWLDPEYRAMMKALLESRRIHPRKTKLQGAELAERMVQVAKEMGAKNKGVPKSAEHRAKLAESLRIAHSEGRAANRKGAVHTEETRAKLRAAWARRKGVAQ